MITALLQETRVWPVIWRRRLDRLRLHSTKNDLVFYGAASIPVLMVVGIVCFAYATRAEIDPAVALVHFEAEQREVVRARKREEDLRCLAENVYFEARGEPLEGQYAVAEVTLNRLQSHQFASTLCGVVHEARWDRIRKRLVAHFSWTELGPLSPQDGDAWKQAMEVATVAYDGREPVVPGALFYHATRITPEWAKSKQAIATIGNHIFYR
jgi:spore germination cell wall hydrolase CwlJ-like protein